MIIENPGIDDDEEIGLTEDEIREIAGDTDLDMAVSQMDLDSERDRRAEDGLEEIDFSDLENEMEMEDDEDGPILEMDDSLESEIAKLKIEDSLESSQEALQNIGNKYYRDEVSDEVSSSAPVATRSANSRASSGERAKSASGRSERIAKAAPPKRITRTTPQAAQARGQSPATRSQSVPARVSKPDGIINNPQKLRALFQSLDEMLAKLPQDQIRQFAFSKEYEYYFEILKKLGI